MSQLSKLSLSKSKAAKRQQESTPSNVVRQAAATVVASQPLHCAPQVNGQQRPPTARSVPRLLDSDDSDWESEPSQPACEAPVHVLPAAAAAAAAAALAPARPQEPGAGAAASTAPGAAPLVGLCGRTTLPLAIGSGGAAHSAAGEPAAQPRLSEVYDLNCSSDEEFQHPPRRPPGSSAPALAASGSKADRVAGVGTTSVSQEAAHPRQQALGFRQPQHRKRSFNQEAVQPVARPARRLTPAATAAGPAAPRATTAATSIDAKAAERGQANGTVSAAKHALAGVGGSSSEPSPGGNTGAPDCGLSRRAHGGGAQLDSNGKQAAGPEGQLPAEAADTSVAVPPEYEDVKAWLQDLQMLQYMAVFVREEVDLSIVHALTAEELASVGITHKPHQATLLAAGQCLGQAQHGVRQQLQPSQQRGTAQLQGSGTALKGPQKASSPARPQPQQRQGWGPLQPPQQQQQQAAGAPRPRPARAGHQSLLQVWQANNLAAAAAEAGCDESPTGRLGRASHAGAQAPPVKAACAGSDAQPPEVVGQQQGMHLSSLGTRPMERALLAQLFPDDAAPGARHQRQQQGRQQAGSASTCDSYALLNPSTVGGLSRVPAGATLWAAAAECRQVAPGMEQRLAKRRADAGLAAAAPAPPLARGGTAYPQVEESRALKLLKLEALKQELTMHEETVSELKRVIRGMEAELGQE